MLKGDLTTTPLAPLLISLSEEPATGCLHISDAEGDEALIYFKNGLVYAVSVPGRRPQLGAKLVSSGALGPEALADALEAQRTELQGWKLGELLVHLGYVDQPVVEAFVKEQVHDAVWDLIRWTEGRWRFRKNEKAREDVAPAMTVTELLTNLRDRGAEWEAISTVVHGPTAVPVLSARGGGAAEMTLDADAWSMLCKIDGERSLAELARDCGYTMFEAGNVLLALVQAGLVDIEEDLDVSPIASVAEPEDGLYGASTVSSALAAAAAAAEAGEEEPAEDEPTDDIAEIARMVSEVAAGVRDDQPAPVDLPSRIALRPVYDDQSFSASIERVSSALADVLGPPPVTDDPFEVPAEMRMRRPQPKPKAEPQPNERRDRLRAAAAEELAAAHALAEELRAAGVAEKSTLVRGSKAAKDADVVDLAAVRREAEAAARAEAERVEAERIEAERVEAERVAAEEAARIEAERLEAERLAAEEAARIEAERAEAERVEAERLAAEEAARIEAERAEAERVEAERLEAERLEAKRLAAEEAARLEAERLEAERLEAERLEAERLAAEEAARHEAERAEAERLEAERLAAEEAARLEAERVEAERAEAERVAAEEAARLETERVAAERVAAEEAARLEAERLEAERAEAERVAAQEAEWAEAERLALEEAARLSAEKSHAEDQAWAEYWAREAQAAQEAAARLVAEQAEREAAAQAAELAAQAAALAAELTEEQAQQEELARRDEETAAEGKRERGRREKSKATALLAELSHEPVGLQPEPVPAVEAIAEPDPEPEPVREPATVGAPMAEMADTAALLRELSSLGLDDDPVIPSPPPPPRSPSRAPLPNDRKKKRGLFGR